MRRWHADLAGIGGSAVKAIRYQRYGPAEVLELRDVGMPAVGGEEMLVRVRAASVNPLDGSPTLRRRAMVNPQRLPGA